MGKQRRNTYTVSIQEHASSILVQNSWTLDLSLSNIQFSSIFEIEVLVLVHQFDTFRDYEIVHSRIKKQRKHSPSTITYSSTLNTNQTRTTRTSLDVPPPDWLKLQWLEQFRPCNWLKPRTTFLHLTFYANTFGRSIENFSATLLDVLICLSRSLLYLNSLFEKQKLCPCPTQFFPLLVQPKDKKEEVIKPTLRSLRYYQLTACIKTHSEFHLVS